VLRYNPGDPEALAAVGPQGVPQSTRSERKGGPLMEMGTAQMEELLSAIQEHAEPDPRPSPIADYEFEITLDELDEKQLSIEPDIKS
jgi:hypothetical protein